MTRIVLQVDKLVLRGIDPADAKAVAAGVQGELQRLLAVPGAASALIAVGDRLRVDTAPTKLAPGAGNYKTGQRIARSILKGVKS